MNASEIQRTRYILHARFRRVQKSPAELFPTACVQLLKWIDNHQIIAPISNSLQMKYEPLSAQVLKLISDTQADISSYNPGTYKATDVMEQAALCYFILKASSMVNSNDQEKRTFQLLCLSEFITGNEAVKIDEALDNIKEIALDSLFEYYDEKIDARNALYGLILKYKQVVEWFKKSELKAIAEDTSSKIKGELALTHHLQEFLVTQGVEFLIEPSSASGEVDLILRDPDGSYIIIDAKYVKETASRSEIVEKISGGFHQVMKYCEDYNQNEGYLVVFIASLKRIRLELEEIDGTNFLHLGNKTIYYNTISIGAEPTASKLGTAEEILINKDELKNIVE